MKKLKITLVTLLATVAISTSVFAYTGTDVDTRYEITMPSTLSQGEGTVSSSATGSFKYQFVDTTATTYANLKKYDAQVNLIKAYIKGESANWEDATLNANYEALVNKYESTYNETVSALYQQLGNIDENALSDVRSLWIHELPNYDSSKWESSTTNKISLDLSTFEGTKYVVAWVQIGDMYDAEVYTVTGTKQNSTEPKDDENKDDKKTDDEKKDDEKQDNTDNKTVDDSKKDTGSVKTNNTIKTDSTKAEGNLPKTGISRAIFTSLISVFTLASIVSFIKYRRIK